MTRSNSVALRCESLEARDVPAIVLDGTFDGTTTTANGGLVNITELGGSITSVDAGLQNAQVVNLSATANEAIGFSTSGTTLTVTDTDGIYIRVVNMGGALVRVGNSLQVQNATALNVNLQLGGNDGVTDNSMLNATIDCGPGNDTIVSLGVVANPALLPLITGPIDPSLYPLLGAAGGAKTLMGGDGDDSITGPPLGFVSQLDGGNGNDVIVGGLGPDILIGGDGVDVLSGLGGGDGYVSLDLFIDYVLNVPGDVVFANAFDVVQVR